MGNAQFDLAKGSVTIDSITGNFIKNTVRSGLGGAIYNTAAPTSSKGIIKEIR